MVDLKERLQRALNPAERKISTGVVNGAYHLPSQQPQRQRYPSNKPSTPNSYYGHQDPFNTAAPAFPQRPTTPFQSNSWATPAGSYSSPPAVASLPPMVNTPAPAPSAQPAQQFHQPAPPQPFHQPAPPQHYQQPAPMQQQYQQPAPPPPPAATVAPPPITGNVSRLGSLNQRNRVYVQDPSVSSGRQGGFYGAASNAPFQQNQMGYMSQPPQSNATMFQPSGSFNNPSPYSQQSNFPGNQFNQPLATSAGSFGQLTNGVGTDAGHQTAPSLYSPLDHVQAPPQQSAFMQPTPFDAPPSITPPLASNPVPSIPTLPATSAPPGKCFATLLRSKHLIFL